MRTEGNGETLLYSPRLALSDKYVRACPCRIGLAPRRSRASANILQVNSLIRACGDGQGFTFEEVEAMRPSRLWKTYRQMRLEGRLMSVPRTERRSLRAYVAGKRIK